MLSLIFVFLVVWFIITAVSGLFSHFFQGAIYSEPAAGFVWRAPAAGTALTLLLACWAFLDYFSPGLYRPLHEMQTLSSSTPTKPEEGAPFPTLTVTLPDGRKEVFFHQGGSKLEYRSKGNMPLSSTPLLVEVEEETAGGKTKSVFKPEKDAKGKFVRQPGLPLVYRDEKSREMVEGGLGALVISRPGKAFLSLLLHLAQFVGWFLCFWLLYDFQWPHALGLGAAFALAVIVFLIPMVLNYTETVAKARSAAVQPVAPRSPVEKAPAKAG
ncbi:MAG: hypothetical protein EXR99_11970 [Gemmataceae bacterium]|nr:hypothetical protein [Gemmataceae bacterium]